MTLATAMLSSKEGETLQIRHFDPAFWQHDGPIEANRYAREHDEYLQQRLAQGDILYHYTSLEGLRGIVQSGEIWASDSRFMNDKLELSYALNQMQRLVSDDPKYTIPAAALDAVFQPGRAWQFVTCFSRARDQLSQWRAYGSSRVSVAIGFDRKHLTKVTESDGGTLSECAYASADELTAIKHNLEPIAAALHQECSSQPDGRLTNVELQGRLSLAAVEIASTIKHPTFSEEREVRAVMPIAKVTPRVKFRTSSGSIIPFVPLVLDRRRLRPAPPIERYANHLGMIEVVVWPADADSQILDAIDMLLVSAGNVLINRSSCPYRT